MSLMSFRWRSREANNSAPINKSRFESDRIWIRSRRYLFMRIVMMMRMRGVEEGRHMLNLLYGGLGGVQRFDLSLWLG